MLGPPGTKSPQISEFKSQSPSPKVQSPCRIQSPRFRTQKPRSRCQDVVWRSQFSKNSFQDPRFNSQKPLDFLGWRPSDTRIQNPSPRDQRFPLVCPYTKSKSQDVQGCRSQVGFRIGHYSTFWAAATFIFVEMTIDASAAIILVPAAACGDLHAGGWPAPPLHVQVMNSSAPTWSTHGT